MTDILEFYTTRRLPKLRIEHRWKLTAPKRSPAQRVVAGLLPADRRRRQRGADAGPERRHNHRWCADGYASRPPQPARRAGRDPVSRNTAEAIAALDAITGDDPEEAHGDADRVLLHMVDVEVAEAYTRVVDRCNGFWYA